MPHQKRNLRDGPLHGDATEGTETGSQARVPLTVLELFPSLQYWKFGSWFGAIYKKSKCLCWPKSDCSLNSKESASADYLVVCLLWKWTLVKQVPKCDCRVMVFLCPGCVRVLRVKVKLRLGRVLVCQTFSPFLSLVLSLSVSSLPLDINPAVGLSLAVLLFALLFTPFNSFLFLSPTNGSSLFLLLSSLR